MQLVKEKSHVCDCFSITNIQTEKVFYTCSNNQSTQSKPLKLLAVIKQKENKITYLGESTLRPTPCGQKRGI